MNGRVPEWLKGTGCKPVGYAYLGSNPSAPTILHQSVGNACVAQSVEHFVGNEEVTGSSLVAGSISPMASIDEARHSERRASRSGNLHLRVPCERGASDARKSGAESKEQPWS